MTATGLSRSSPSSNVAGASLVKSSNVEQAVPHPLDPSASLMTIPVLGPMRLADVRIGLWVAEGNPVEAVLAQDEDTVG